MTNVVKNRIMRILAIIAIVCVGMVAAFSIRPANAEQNIAGENEFAVQQEAGIYIGDKLSGISFKTDVDKTFYQGLADEEVEFYTLVTAYNFLVDGDITSLTVETASEMEAVHLKAPSGIQFNGEAQTWTYDVAITYEDAGLSDASLKKAYQTNLVARSYLKKADGTIIYADNDFVGTSIEEVAQKELAKALNEQAVLSTENVEKFMQYLPEKDVKAYFDKAGEIEFIDQFMDGAEVYVVNDTKDNFDLISTIQNGKLTSNTITLGKVGDKTEYVISDGEKAFKANATQVTTIINSAQEFKDIFWTPNYHVSVTHTIEYQGQTLTETFNDIDNPEMLYRTNSRVYMLLSDDFVTKLANGATRKVDSQTVTADPVNGYYVLSENIYDLGSNGSTYTYNFKLGIVTANSAAAGATATKTTDAYDNAGYKYAGNNAFLYAQDFTGTFDGLGHIVDGMTSATQAGIFGTLNNATIKNVAFTNVESTADGGSTGIIAYQNKGVDTLIENVYIQINSIPNSTRWGAIYYNNNSGATKKSTLRNVVIDMPTRVWDTTATFGAGIIGSSTSSGWGNHPVTENVVAITGTDLVCGYGANNRVTVAENDADLIAENGKYATFSLKKIQTGLFRYDDMASAISANAFANFTADCWRFNKDGSIAWKSMPVNAGTHIYSAKDNTIPETLFDNIDGEILSIEDTTGVEILADGKLTLENDTKDIISTDVIITTTSGVYSATILAYTDIIDSNEEFTEIFYTPNYHLTTTFNIKLADGSTYSETVSDITHPELVSQEKVSNTRVLNLSATAKEKLALEGSTRLADTGITVSADPIVGAFLLGTDLTLNNASTSSYGGMWRAVGRQVAPTTPGINTDDLGYNAPGQNAFLQNQQFTGLFDGNGHVINLTIGAQGGLLGYLNNATAKNFALNATFKTDTAGGVAQNANAGSTIQDVYLNADFTGNRNGGIINNSNTNPTIKNIVIVSDFDKQFDDMAYGFGYIAQLAYQNGYKNYSNIYVVGPTKFISSYSAGTTSADDRIWVAENEAGLLDTIFSGIGTGNSSERRNIAKGVKRYDNMVALGVANNDYTSFNSAYWDISTGIPVWRALANTITTDWRDEVNATVEVRANGEKVEEITFGSTDGDTKTFELYSELITINATVEVEDQRVVTYADGVITKVGVGATKLSYTYTISGKKYSGEIIVSVTQGQFIKGEGQPDSTIGADGDTYLDSATNDIYAKEDGNWVLVGNLDGEVAIRLDGGLVQDTTIYTTDTFMGNTYKNSVTIEIFKNAQLVDGQIIILNNQDYINLENGVITATKEGEVDIRIIYTHNDVDFIEEFTLTIVKPVANHNELVENFSALDGDLPLTEIFGKEVTLIGAKNLDDPTNLLTVQDNKVLGLKTSRLGKTTARIELESTESRMIVDLEGYTMIIDEAKDFTKFNLVSNSIDGYFIVVNDIEYDATVPVNTHPGRDSTGGFIGVFDGNGHKITVGVAYDGIFGKVGVGGVIKDAAFVNTVFTTQANNQTSFVIARVVSGSSKGYATITNCYFEQNDFRSAAQGNRTAFISVGRGTVTVDNVLFNVNMPQGFESVPYGGGVLWTYDSGWTSGTTQSGSSSISLTNVYVVGNFKYMARIWATDHYRSYYAENEGIANDGYESFTYLGVYRYNTFEDLGENNTCKWQYVDGKVVFVEDVDFFVPEASYNLQGRAQEYANTYKFQLPSAGIDIAFKGNNLELKLQNAGNVQAKVRIYIDDQIEDVLFLDTLTTYTKTGLGEGEHVVRIVNAYEESTGWILRGVKVDEFAPISKDNLRIQILGDSITTGYGATKESGSLSHSITNSDSTFSYSYLVPLALGADYSIVAKQGITVAKPTAVSMLDLYDHMSLTNSNVPEEEFDVVIVNLGTNDASCSNETNFDADEYRANFSEYYKQLLTKIRERNPNAKIVCVFNMMIRNNVQIIEDGIIEAVTEMNDDNIFYKVDFTHAVNGHPNRYEHASYAQILTAYLKGLLNIQ